MAARVGQEPTTERLAEVRPARRHGRAHRPLRSKSPRRAVLLSARLAGGVAAALFGRTGRSVASAGTAPAMGSAGATPEAERLRQAWLAPAEAQPRLQEVAAARAASAQPEEATREAARPKFVLPIN